MLPMHQSLIVRFLFPLMFFCLCSCVTTREQEVVRDHSGITLYLDSGQTMEDFFQSHRVLISAFEVLPEAQSRGQPGVAVSLDYPSINEKGNSPLYSHRAQVVPAEGVPVQLEDLDPRTTFLVLQYNPVNPIYELIGTVTLTEIPPFDFFQNLPEYHFVGE
jgi:hypothetical protein